MTAHVPKRNRVTPMGDLVATELRGAWTGNRGILHRGTDIVRFHAGDLWIICALQHTSASGQAWQLPQWAPGHFTVLFFHDEAVALAAGHRPCALCRRDAYDDYREAWAAGKGVAEPSAQQINAELHHERIIPRTHKRRLHESTWPAIPTGTFVLVGDTAGLVLDATVIAWTPRGYARSGRRPASGPVNVITPPSTVAALAAGYQPQIDPAALRLASGSRWLSRAAGLVDRTGPHLRDTARTS